MGVIGVVFSVQQCRRNRGLPLTAPGVSILQVMNRGGSEAATAADSWSEIAFDCQRDSDLADKVYQVYQCYLQPLELDLPNGFR